MTRIGLICVMLVCVSCGNNELSWTETSKQIKESPHWLRDAKGNAVYFAGHAVHGLYQDAFESVNYAAHLDNMAAWGTNLQRMRLWMNAWTLNRGSKIIYPVNPPIYLRSGVSGANDGGNKFDLDAFNDEFFAGLRQRVQQASDRGIYTMIALYLSNCTPGGGDGDDLWHGHPWNAANNINGIDVDQNADGAGCEIYDGYGRSGVGWERHVVYINKVVNALAGIDRVMWEVGNEMPIASAPFQYQVIRHLKSVSSAPAGMSAHGDWQFHEGTDNYNGPYADLVNNPGEWLAPAWEGNNAFLNDPPVETRKIVFNDTDHTLGWDLPPVDWIWRAFTRVFQRGGGLFTVELEGGKYAVEWLRPHDGAVFDGGVVAGAARRAFTPPFGGDAVLYLRAK